MSAAGAGAGAVVRQGHLRKLKTMKKKYFVLRSESTDCSARLDYYESEKKFRAGAAPRRVLPLKSCYNITRRLDLKQKHVIALFTREEQFCVVAENEQELHAWLSAILRQHSSDEHSDELLHPIQHVWQVNVQKKGLGASKNIQGLYNLCLTDKTLTLVKIKSHNNVISDLGIPERVEYSLKNIRRCGDSECFFYMEVGRQTATGAGELWMHSDDANIAQSMHSTIYHAMRNCAKETENEKDHISMPKGEGTNPLPARRQTYSDGHGRAGLSNDKGLCVGSCIRQCVCATTTYSIDDSAAAIAPLTPRNDAAGAFRNRCDSMPSRACASLEAERPPTRHAELIEGLDASRDETDTVAEWHRTPRIPEEPDYCEMGPRDLISKLARESAQHSRTSSFGASETSPEGVADGYLPMAPDSYLPMAPDSYLPMAPDSYGAMAPDSYGAMATDGYLPMAPLDHGLVSASSGSVCSGTPSTDPRFSEYQLEPATSHIVDADERPPRAYSVGSRPAPPRPDATRLRAYSVGARNRPPPAHLPVRATRASSSAPLLPRASADDLMELDFSHHPPPQQTAKVIVSRTPPSAGFVQPRGRPAPDEDSAGYVEMRPGAGALGLSPPRQPATPDGYVEMRLGSRTPLRPPVLASSPQTSRSLLSDTLFPLMLEAPEPEPAEPEPEPEPELELHQPLTTLREISEEGARKSPELSSSPSYVSLSRQSSRADDPAKRDAPTVVKAGVRCASGAALHYAALDLEPRGGAAQPPPRVYTQIDFLRSEKLHAADN